MNNPPSSELDHERIARAVKASLIGYDPRHKVDFLVKEVEPGIGKDHGEYVCTYLGFHVFKARRGKDFFHLYCERMIEFKDVDL